MNPKFKVGDKVRLRNDVNDPENQCKLSDLESDMLQDLQDRSLSGTAYDAFYKAIETGQPFTITAVITADSEDSWPMKEGDEPHYELKLRKWALGYRIEESQLVP